MIKRLLCILTVILGGITSGLSLYAKTPYHLCNEPLLNAGEDKPNVVILKDNVILGSGSSFVWNFLNNVLSSLEAQIFNTSSNNVINKGELQYAPPASSTSTASRSYILTNLAGTTGSTKALSSWTLPLSSSLYELGRYMLGTSTNNNNLSLHPDQSYTSSGNAFSLFPYLSDANGLSTNAPINTVCQRNFVIVHTSSQPALGYTANDYSSLPNSPLRGYYNSPTCAAANASCTTTALDIANALFDMDLRPDLTLSSNNYKKTNIKTSVFDSNIASSSVNSYTSMLQKLAAISGGTYNLDSNGDPWAVGFFEYVFGQTTQMLQQGSTAISNNTATSSNTQSTELAQGSYDSKYWSGDITYSKLDANGSLTQLWKASTLLNTRDPNTRVIISFSPSTKQGLPFANYASLPTSIQQDLNQGSAPGFSSAGDSLGAQRLAYIRGSRSLEGSTFRKRGSVLGDFTDTMPLIIEQANRPWPDVAPFPTGTNAYSAFKTSVANRTPVVYAGANDGMLHAFYSRGANAGQELFAYIPGGIYSSKVRRGLHYLTDPSYLHQYYADFPLTSEDVYTTIPGNGTPQWRTLLLGGYTSGQFYYNGSTNGYYAIDITDPSQMTNETSAAGKVLWEFNQTDNNGISRPVKPAIGLMPNGKWAMVITSGLQPDRGTATSLGAIYPTSNDYFFIVYLSGPTGASGTWVSGTDYLRIPTASASPSGLSSPTLVDVNGDKVIDYVYAGDGEGRLWALNTTNWTVRQVFSGPSPGTTSAQPISTQPQVKSYGSPAANNPNVMVLFGTGRLAGTTDKANIVAGSIYGVHDTGGATIASSVLTEQTLSQSGNFGTLSNNTVDSRGWKINLSSNEQVIFSPVLVNDNLYVSTAKFNTGICAFGGSGKLFVIDALTGSNPKNPVLDTNNDGQINTNDQLNGKNAAALLFANTIPKAPSLTRDKILLGTSSGQNIIISADVVSTKQSGRSSFQELAPDP